VAAIVFAQLTGNMSLKVGACEADINGDIQYPAAHHGYELALG
jgi:hypothetical protein